MNAKTRATLDAIIRLRAAEQMMREAAPDMHSALLKIKEYCAECARTGQATALSWIDNLAGNAIAKAEGKS